MELKIYKSYCHVKFNKILNNINSEQFTSLSYFIKVRSFKIVECDKNIDFCVVSHEIYDELCFLHLNNTSNFIKLNYNLLEETQLKIKEKLLELKLKKDISTRLYNNLIVKNYKLGSFRILPKLHKEKFSTRPIINCINHPTSRLCILIDCLLQNFVKNASCFIQDRNLIQSLEQANFNSQGKLYSIDIESLYSNIDLDDALAVVCQFIRNKMSFNEININRFYNILKLIFKNNIFKYKKNFFLN